MNTTPTDLATVQARRVRFVPAAQPHDHVLREFAQPQRTLAICETLTAEACTQVAAGPAVDHELLFLFLPAGAATPPEWQQRAAQWLAGPVAQANHAPLEVMLRSDRVVWRPGRALFQGAPERMDEALAALAEFAFLEGQLRRLERDLDADTVVAQGDVALTHSVTSPDLARREHVNDMTRRTTARRLYLPLLERSLESPSADLSGSARRLLAELGNQADVADRLESLEDRNEVIYDLYELANDRLSEFGYYRSEWWLELWIIVILLAELVGIGLELWMNW